MDSRFRGNGATLDGVIIGLRPPTEWKTPRHAPVGARHGVPLQGPGGDWRIVLNSYTIVLEAVFDES